MLYFLFTSDISNLDCLGNILQYNVSEFMLDFYLFVITELLFKDLKMEKNEENCVLSWKEWI